MSSQPAASDPPPPVIDRLAAAVVTTARNRRGQWLFVGWAPDERPAATTDPARLSEDALRAAQLYQGAGLSPRRIPYAKVAPVEYVMTGSAIDFADTADKMAEDQIRYTVVDAGGDRRDIALGELAALGAIADARVPWQATGNPIAADVAVSAVPLFTIFAPQPGRPPDACVALLFRSAIPSMGNTAAFHAFVRQTLSRLLVLDESQPKQNRKGYLDVAGRLAGPLPSGGVAGTLLWLRRLGLVDFSDQWIRNARSSGTRAQGRLARLLRAVGLAYVSDDVLEQLTDARPDYDIEPLETEQLVDLAAAMYEVARKALKKR